MLKKKNMSGTCKISGTPWKDQTSNHWCRRRRGDIN
jgi:hypothetical protein